jgi:peptide/nickel transport system substrate-binding protein
LKQGQKAMHAQKSRSNRVARGISRRTLLRAAASTAAAAGLAACSRGGQSAPSGSSGAAQAPSGTPKPGGTFNSYLTANPQLDVQKAAIVLQAVGCVYSRPFRFKTGIDPTVSLNHEIEPELAVSAESPDAITWTLKLRPDAKFQNIAPVNGHAVEAEDVKDSILRILDPKTLSQFKNNYAMIDPAQMQSPDPQTIVFKLKYPFAPFPNLLASPSWAYIYPREGTTGAFDPTKVAIGSGPFILDSNTPDVAVIFKRNPDYFEKGVPNVDGMKLAIVGDSAQQQAQFVAKNLDEILLGSINDVNAVQKEAPAATIIKAGNASPNPFYFQLGDPTGPLMDLRVRQAFSMAIDRDNISKTLYNGQSEQMVFVPSYLGKWALRVQDLDTATQQYYKYNPTQAKQLLQAAGATDLQLKITYANAFASPTFLKQADIIAGYLKDVGVKSTQVMVDFNKDWIDSGKGIRAGYYAKDTIVFATQGSLTDADDALFGYFDSRSTSNEEHLSDATMDDMIAKERTQTDDDARLKAVLDIQRYLAQKMFCVSTIGTDTWFFVLPRVQNYQYSSTIGRTTETYAKLWLKQ